MKPFLQNRFRLYLGTCFKHKFDRINTSSNTFDGSIKYRESWIGSHVMSVQYEFDRVNGVG
jgi:hypothetical protein